MYARTIQATLLSEAGAAFSANAKAPTTHTTLSARAVGMDISPAAMGRLHLVG